MREGIVIKAYGGFYYVKSGNEICKCVLRGRFRRQGQQVLVGDQVKFRVTEAKSGVIEEVLPRRNVLVRPLVANVEQAILVFAMRDPDPSPFLLDRLLIQARAAQVTPFICFNKADLGGKEAAELISVYQQAGYPVLVTSAKDKTGLGGLRKILSAGVTVLAGPSGTGKSSLLNALEPGLSLKTREVSTRIRRGRHTTRHVELLTLTGGGLVVDTPGFSSLHLPLMERTELAYFFPEFREYIPECQFTGCLHYKEPGCAVKQAVADLKISPLRYENYLKFLNEVIEQEKRKYD
ncbi:MAG: ribosome small subunit-dependent GTPase A [Bacillota bacterium]